MFHKTDAVLPEWRGAGQPEEKRKGLEERPRDAVHRGALPSKILKHKDIFLKERYDMKNSLRLGQL